MFFHVRASVVVVSLGFASFAAPELAFAGEPGQVTSNDTPPNPHVAGGQIATSCQWPTSVGLVTGSAGCSGTLVHPRVITTAAHCLTPNLETSVRFGESSSDPLFTIPVEYCLENPAYPNGQVHPTDYAFCVLTEEVPLPPTPPLMGCELEELDQGDPVVLVGFGTTGAPGSSGTKRWVNAEIENVGNNFIAAGDQSGSTCSGDSGSSGFFQLPDGGWRSWGILSGGPEGCPNVGYFVPIAAAVPWIESESGIDITPCHDADGTWNPGPECQGVATNPDAGGGDWEEVCPDMLSAKPDTCGPAGDFPVPESPPPEVSFTTPLDGDVFVDVPSIFDIVVETNQKRFAVVQVELFIDGELVITRNRKPWDPYEPWVFADASFPPGVYELCARAEEYDGDDAEACVEFTVEDPAAGDGDGDPAGDGDGDPDTGDGDGDSGSESEGDTGDPMGGGETTGIPVDGISDEGCACSSQGSKGGAGAALLLPLLLLGLRRRE